TLTEDLGSVPVAKTIPHCEGENQPSDVEILADSYTPTLKKTPLTYSEILPIGKPASQLLSQNPRKAIPQVTLTSTPPPEILPAYEGTQSTSPAPEGSPTNTGEQSSATTSQSQGATKDTGGGSPNSDGNKTNS